MGEAGELNSGTDTSGRVSVMNLAEEEPGHGHDGSKETCLWEVVIVALHSLISTDLTL